jgi:hypothetical protein
MYFGMGIPSVCLLAPFSIRLSAETGVRAVPHVAVGTRVKLKASRNVLECHNTISLNLQIKTRQSNIMYVCEMGTHGLYRDGASIGVCTPILEALQEANTRWRHICIIEEKMERA